MIEYMKRLLVVIAVLLCVTVSAQNNPKPFVIPEITSWSGAQGDLIPSGRVAVKGSDKELQRIAAAFVADYKLLTGRELSVVKGSGKAGDIVLQLDKKATSLGKEGYKLSVGEQAVVSAHNLQGAFWATQTLLQLAEQSDNGAMPKGEAVDIPQYEMRGFMIDCGRKFFPMDYLRKLVKIMAYYKMNTLQVHLNDNGFRQYFDNDWSKTQAAFRLESDTYPGLAAKDGSYSKQEFIDMQILAEQNYVEVIPEIDVPAHSLAFTHYKPEIGSKEYGMDHLDLFNPETYKFVDGLFREYLEGENPVFRGKRVHIGTDEYSNAKKEVVEKFREFTDHYIRFVEGFGKQAMCWGALTHAKGDTPVKSENVIMNCWYNGYANPRDMKEQGYQLVSIPDGFLYIVPAAGYYYDYLNCNYLYDHWTPAIIGNQKFDEQDPAILGGMFAVWNDHAGNGISVKDVHHRVFPAMQTLAVKCWSGKLRELPYAEFDKKRKELSEAPGVNELALFGVEQREVYSADEVKAGAELPIEEIGYDYTISFTLEGAPEQKGTELFRSANAVFYLSDPESGQLGFAREGYLNKFNFRVPQSGKVEIKIQGNNKFTRLYVNGRMRQELGPLTLYAMKPNELVTFQASDENAWKPVMYNPGTKMYYQRTLVFPLRKAGDFKSRISNFKVFNYLK